MWSGPKEAERQRHQPGHLYILPRDMKNLELRVLECSLHDPENLDAGELYRLAQKSPKPAKRSEETYVGYFFLVGQ